MVLFRILPILAVLIPACGGGASSRPQPPAPEPPSIAAPDFSAIGAEVERWHVPDATLIIGDATGELYRYEKGAVRADTQVNIASASKLLTGLAVWTVIETGALSEASRPQDHIGAWTDAPSDPRARVTVDQLMSFRSGFNSRPSDGSCPGNRAISLEACISRLYEKGVRTEPGEAFAYGPDHMQITALMVREATGRELSAIMDERIWSEAGVGPATTFPSTADNVRYSGGIRSTAEDYARILAALTAGDLIALDTGFLSDRTADAQIAYTIPAIRELDADWHYGFGFWIECDSVPFADECARQPVISSPGAFGFLPWVDFETGYWAVLATEQPLSSNPRPSVASVQLQQILQPMIAVEF